MKNLETYLEQLNEWLRKLSGQSSGQAPSWTQVRIVEDAAIRREGTHDYIASSDLFTPEDYAPRFDALLQQGYSWLNLNGAGIVGDTLIIVVEQPARITGTISKTSINFSGPRLLDGKPRWDATGFITIT